MNLSFAILLIGLLPFQTIAQPKRLGIEKLPLDTLQRWNNPQFSPSGARVFFTESSFNGIWEFTLLTQKVRMITNDQRSGHGYSISADETQIAYRRTLTQQKTQRKTHEIVVKRLDTGSTTVAASSPDVSSPAYAGNQLVYSLQRQTQNLALIQPMAEAMILGVENTKIVVILRGTKALLDPLGNGSYIWPALSPDRTLLVAYEMDRGAFVCDLQGNIAAMLGRTDSPSWTRSGKWIIYMDDKDNGHRMISSDLSYVSREGTRRGRLTNTPDVFELNPQCSPVEDKIVYQSERGEIFIMSYTE